MRSGRGHSRGGWQGRTLGGVMHPEAEPDENGKQRQVHRPGPPRAVATGRRRAEQRNEDTRHQKVHGARRDTSYPREVQVEHGRQAPTHQTRL